MAGYMYRISAVTLIIALAVLNVQVTAAPVLRGRSIGILDSIRDEITKILDIDVSVHL